MPEPAADIRADIRRHIFENCLEAAAKLHGVGELFDERVPLLEQAAIIRQSAQQLWTNLHALDMFADEDGTPAVPPEYVGVLDQELILFQVRFRQ